MTDTETRATHDFDLTRGGDAAAIVDAALAAAEPQHLGEDGTYAVVVPNGGRLELVDLELEKSETRPRRKRELVRLHTGDALASYVEKHDEGDGSAVLFADVDAGRVVAILNAPTDTAAGWSDHRAELTLRLTPAWKLWTAQDGRMLTQVDFAEHIEAGLVELVEPDAASLLELSQTFEAYSSARFKSATRLDSGERQFTYEETIDARAGRTGQLTIPAEFVLGLQPFEGSEVYRVRARLRYRLRDGALLLGYMLDRPEDVLRAAFDAVLAVVEERTGVEAWRGTPPQ